MILVTGATGTVGSEVVKQLLAQGQSVRVLTRDPAKAGKLGSQVAVVVGDLSQPDTLAPAFAGSERMFLSTVGQDIRALEANAIAAAKAAGVKHIVKLSALGAGNPPSERLVLAHHHAAGESALKDSGIPWTVVRAGTFAANALQWAGMIKAQGAVFQAAGEGKTAPTDPRDIAAAAVHALVSPIDQQGGQIYEITGPEALSTAEQVAIISAAIGKPLRYMDIPPAAARANMLRVGMPEQAVDAVLQLMAALRAGSLARVTDTFEKVLGRKPHSFADWVRDHKDGFI